MMNSCGAAVSLHSVCLVRFRSRTCDRVILRKSSVVRAGLYDVEEYLMPEEEISIDPGMFEEIFPTVPKQKVDKSARNRKVESTTKTVLIPDEWIGVQKHQQRTKKEKKQETIALMIQRARERELEDRATEEEAASKPQARLFRGSIRHGVPFGKRNVEGNVLDNTGVEEVEKENWKADLETMAVESVSRRAVPKDYRSGLEFTTFEEVAESLRDQQSAEDVVSIDTGGEDIVEEEPQIVTLSAEEKAMLRSRKLNFAKISSKSWSPLHTLAAAGQVYLAAEIIKRGVQVDAVDKEGLTAMHRAIQSGRKMIVRLLLKAQANIQVRDKDGATLLHYAAQTGSHDIAKLLLRENIDVNAADNDGWTALHVAVQSGRTELIRLLVNRGADMNKPNNDGNTPLDLSFSFGSCFKFYDTIKFMKRKEAEFRRTSSPRNVYAEQMSSRVDEQFMVLCTADRHISEVENCELRHQLGLAEEWIVCCCRWGCFVLF